MVNHIATAMDRLIDLQLERQAWIPRAAEQIRRWKEEDAAAGMPWGDSNEGSGRGIETASGR